MKTKRISTKHGVMEIIVPEPIQPRETTRDERIAAAFHYLRTRYGQTFTQFTASLRDATASIRAFTDNLDIDDSDEAP